MVRRGRGVLPKPQRKKERTIDDLHSEENVCAPQGVPLQYAVMPMKTVAPKMNMLIQSTHAHAHAPSPQKQMLGMRGRCDHWRPVPPCKRQCLGRGSPKVLCFC